MLHSSLRRRRLKRKEKGILGARQTRPARFSRAYNSLPFFQTPATRASFISIDKTSTLSFCKEKMFETNARFRKTDFTKSIHKL